MTAQLQFRRGTTVQHTTFTGAIAEPTFDTTLNTLIIHDAATAGGLRMAKFSELAAQASTGVVGKTRYASSTEALAGTSTATAMTPAGVALTHPTQSSTGNVGITRYASSTEAVAAASTATAVTPAGLGLHAAPLVGNKNLTGGFTATSFSISSSTSLTPSGLNGQLQYLTNSADRLINVPAADTAVDIWVTNSTAPGTITFSTAFLIGSTSVVGALSTGASANGLISIRRINGKSTYVLHNISTF